MAKQGANNQELMKELAELKEENKKLKDRVYTENIRKVKELRGEINKLKDELEVASSIADLTNATNQENNKLREENKKLKEYNKHLEVDWEVAGNDLDKLREENEKLKEVNKNLIDATQYGYAEKIVELSEKLELKKEEWWRPAYESFEEAIVGEYGDQSEQAKKYGFGVFKKD